MRIPSKFLLIVGGGTTLALQASTAHAQLDLQPPLPNVLLLLDNSGSMERTVAGNDPTCSPGATPAPPELERSRWTNVIEALTGPIQGFSCYAQPRTGNDFLTQFSINGVPPYDRGYYINYHRPLSNGCTKGPHSGAIVDHPYNNPAGTCATPWSQLETGFLDNAKDLVRFSMMTFDTITDEGTGVSNTADGVQGMWSYYLNFQGGGGHAAGQPPGCLTPQDFEVGSRNPAAPEWEGPLVPFPTPDASLNDVRANNDRIQRSLVALRPYGATPLAGMFSDALVYLTQDDSTWDGKDLGPKDDPCIINGVRDQFIILLSDGEPNMDLRDPNPAKDCASGIGPGPDGDGCPYRRPWDVADDLHTNHNIRTFTIGYSLSTLAGVDCEELDSTSFAPGGQCENPASSALRACCTLTRIAIEGGSQRGYFPDNIAELNQALSNIFLDIAPATSRTIPVTAGATPASGGGAGAAGYEFSSSFNPQPQPGYSPLWTGNLERKRRECEDINGQLVANPQAIAVNEGDNFGENMRQTAPSPRRFFTVFGQPDGGAIHSTRSIRPVSGGTDGLGTYTGTMTGGGVLVDKGSFASQAAGEPRAFGLDPATAVPSQCTAVEATNAADCARSIMDWQLGDNVAGAQRSSLLGAIFHSTPTIVGPPRDLVTDDTYELFANQNLDRPLTLYTATTDGQLHAFNVEVASEAQNELWSFFPPHTLPRVVSTFNQQAPLLDGAPVVKNVIFERSISQAVAGTSTWRTVLVASGGGGGSFYYALDVTDPDSPSFLWQLSTDEVGGALFGEAPPTPAIATIEVSENGDPQQTREVAVAILAGGGATLGTGTCPRQGGPTLIPNTSPYQARNEVRCWGSNPAIVGPGRSITIVRLDNGRVIRTFRGHQDDGPPGLASANRVTTVPFDSPLTGVPVAYPSQTGQVADRIYIGDSDGTLWRIDVSSADPDDWGVRLAWDAYSLGPDTGASGQPIATPPIVSIDEVGNTVVLFSTGDQETFNASPDLNTRLWSLTESVDYSGGSPILRIEDNWRREFTGGQRVTGPISLFDSVAYFSTYTPLAANASECADGYGTVWGLQYRSGEGMLPSANNPNTFVEFEDQPQGTVVFGVAVTQTPSCSEEVNVNDPYFPPGIFSSPTGGVNYQLTFHTGSKGTSNAQGGITPTSVIALPRPENGIRIDSWAGVVE
ncbi:PilC/PilY family type IV pilus protein [Chondromyces apiculatus]|uniref:Type IV fimbrial biogenesis protein PilY1 n=1 Tax=Chondromyces apiculatus DSM 436 TaxID=1192034 RepID=A0A017SXK2_9BACT|nr:PilC/PilY family type IV pilus protein [Chondromyces apiculatus]EYF01714.1 Type IV fimbrial biogenesis protein PilY1 [Chondromyces apiculatus DSM 436]